MLAFVLLSSSVAVDVISPMLDSDQLKPMVVDSIGSKPNLGGLQLFLEDGAKWLGIATWCSYFAHTSYQIVVKTLPSKAL